MMDKNDNNDLELLDLSRQAADRLLFEWTEGVLAERARKRLPTIQID